LRYKSEKRNITRKRNHGEKERQRHNGEKRKKQRKRASEIERNVK
jgi:hypothetical protein